MEEAGAAARGAGCHCWLKKAGSSGGGGRDGTCGRAAGEKLLLEAGLWTTLRLKREWKGREGFIDFQPK